MELFFVGRLTSLFWLKRLFCTESLTSSALTTLLSTIPHFFVDIRIHVTTTFALLAAMKLLVSLYLFRLRLILFTNWSKSKLLETGNVSSVNLATA